MSLRALETGYHPPKEEHHGAVQPLGPQFEDIDQQNECYIVGMWTFLVTEVMFFGALFLAYSVYRVLYTSAYEAAHHFLNVPLGTTNTFVLLFSSLSMALAVKAAQDNKPKLQVMFLAITIICSFAFMGIKYVEYSSKFREHLFPGPTFDFAYANKELAKEHAAARGEVVEEHAGEHHYEYIPPASRFDDKPEVGFNNMVAPTAGTALGQATVSAAEQREDAANSRAQLFFCLYFAMTGLHAIHIIVGILMMGLLIWLVSTKHPSVQDYMPTEMVGLYWHFVDIVWIFLFPMMYLIS
jgi:cytochrome c oxidase subunit 3